MTGSTALLTVALDPTIAVRLQARSTEVAATTVSVRIPVRMLKERLARKEYMLDSTLSSMHLGAPRAAFTKGCTLEAHDFAEATAAFKRQNATVVGITAGNINRIAEFSALECRNKFLVAADPNARIAASYDAKNRGNPAFSDRTSYVIAPNGRIVASYTDNNPDLHVEKMLEAVKSLRVAK
ncbi:MAG: peroxiredoxin [Steroidobacteraceae bacterium]